jgi:O-antigen ligase
MEITQNVSRETFWEDKNRDIGKRTFVGITSNNFWLGAGVGTFTLEIPKYINDIDGFWNFQPVHNIYMLIWAELGLLGLLIFLLIIVVLILLVINKFIDLGKNVSRETFLKENYERFTMVMLLGLLMANLFIGIFDHYFITLDQGRFIFWLGCAFLGVCSGNTNAIKKENVSRETFSR